MLKHLSGEEYLRLAENFGQATANLVFHFLKNNEKDLGGGGSFRNKGGPERIKKKGGKKKKRRFRKKRKRRP